MIDKHFYKQIINLENSLNDDKTTFSDKFFMAKDVSFRGAATINFYIDYAEKLKNILLWKHYRKS